MSNPVDPSKKGRLFSQQYVERSSPLPDSRRCRVRMGQYLGENFDYKMCQSLGVMLTRELGIEMPPSTSYAGKLAEFYKEADIVDVLDAATLIFGVLRNNFHDRSVSNHWKAFVERALKEGNLAYTVDEDCGVHPLVDREFARNIATAVAGLGIARYDAVRAAFNAAEAKLEQSPADMKGAIRDCFESLETLTKLISVSGKALTAGFVKSELEPRIQRLYVMDDVAKMSAARLAQSFSDWIDAAHPYRHGHEVEEPIALPDELAILLVSQGASFLRWLIDLDLQLGGKAKI